MPSVDHASSPSDPVPALAPLQTDGAAMRAYRAIREFLLSGTMVGGDVIQERRLADELGFSRTPVREALQRLEGEGLLERQDRFLRVATVTMADVMEILSVRTSLECDAVRAAAGRIPLARIEAVRERIEALVAPNFISDDEHWAADDLLHLTIAEESGNRLLARLIAELRQKTRLFGLRRIPSRFAPGKEEHLGILDALARADTEEAAKRMKQHLLNTRQSILSALPGQSA